MWGNKDSDCDQNNYLRCQSGICNCSTNYYYTSGQCGNAFFINDSTPLFWNL